MFTAPDMFCIRGLLHVSHSLAGREEFLFQESNKRREATMDNTSMNGTRNEGVKRNNTVKVKFMVVSAMLGAVSVILMLFEFPLPFAPGFYKLDISEVPVLIGTFAMGPLAGAVTELIKILLNFVINGTTTGGVGEFANFLIGCSFCVPAGIIYQRMRTKKGACIALASGTVIMTVVGCVINAYILLPTYAAVFGMPIDSLIAMGSAVNPAIDGIWTFILLAVMPFNLLKGVIVSVILLLVYKKISPILHKKIG